MGLLQAGKVAGRAMAPISRHKPAIKYSCCQWWPGAWPGLWVAAVITMHSAKTVASGKYIGMWCEDGVVGAAGGVD